MDGLHKKWGERVRQRRIELGYSQDELARRAGTRQATISRVELGLQVPSDQLKWLVCGALGSRLDDMFPWPSVVPPAPDPDR